MHVPPSAFVGEFGGGATSGHLAKETGAPEPGKCAVELANPFGRQVGEVAEGENQMFWLLDSARPGAEDCGAATGNAVVAPGAIAERAAIGEGFGPAATCACPEYLVLAASGKGLVAAEFHQAKYFGD